MRLVLKALVILSVVLKEQTVITSTFYFFIFFSGNSLLVLFVFVLLAFHATTAIIACSVKIGAGARGVGGRGATR